MTAGLSRACAGVWGHRDPGPPCRRDGLAARAGGWGGWRLGGCNVWGLGPGASMLDWRRGREALKGSASVAGSCWGHGPTQKVEDWFLSWVSCGRP